MLLDAVDKSIEVYLGAAKTTNDCPVTAFYVDHVAAGGTPGASDATTNGVTVFTAVAAPAVATRRQVKMITVYNADTVNTDIYIQLNHGGTTRLLGKFIVLPAETLVYQNEIGFKINPTMSEITIMGDASLANQTLLLGDVGDASASTLTSIYGILGNPATTLTAQHTAIKNETALIVADTGELQTDWANGGRLDLLLDAAAAGGGGDATIANQNLILADVGDASASTLASIYGILGNPATTITAQLTAIDDYIDTEIGDIHTDVGSAITQATNAASDAVLLKADVGDASASTLTSIYGILGNPATTITAQIAAVAAQVTAVDDYVDTEVASLMADVGDASAATLGSIYGILGNPAATSISTDVAATHAHAAVAETQSTNAASDAVLLKADIGDASAATLGSILGILGDPLITITAQITDVHGHANTADTEATAAHVDAGTAATDTGLIKADLGDISGSTLGSLLAIVGNPAATSISDDVAATHAHAATADTEATAAHVDAGTAATDTGLLKADLGDASASTLGSIYAILGNPAATPISDDVAATHAHAATADTEATAAHVDAGTAATDTGLLKADIGDASASTLTSIYGILGNPATTITAQITDAHDHASTAATQSTNAAADAVLLKADLGDASGSTLTSIYGILGNPATTLTAQHTAIKTEVDKIGTIVNTGGAATIGAVLGDFANSALVTRVADLHTDVADIHTDVADIHTDVGTVHTDADAILADIGDASASTLGSIYAILGNPAATAISTDVAAVHVHAGSIETKVDTLDTNVDTLNTRLNRYQHKDIFWSAPQISVTVDTTHTDAALPSVILPNITGTIIHAYAGFKFRMISNSNAAVNKLSGAQEIQVKENAAGAFTDCINFVDDQFGVAASTREGGDVIMGNIDVVAEVSVFNKTYAFQWDEPLSDQTALIFWDVQTFLIVTWY